MTFFLDDFGRKELRGAAVSPRPTTAAGHTARSIQSNLGTGLFQRLSAYCWLGLSICKAKLSARNEIRANGIPVAHFLSKAKISHLQEAVLVKQQVLGLQVPALH